ncbi:hypothetical protein GCM10022221_66790 [Actinocorallia aurea]
MASEGTEEAQSRLRVLNRGIVAGSIAAVGALLVATDADSWGEALLLGAGLVVTLVVINRWDSGCFARVALAGLVCTGGIWAAGVLAADSTQAAYGFAITATIVFFELPRRRTAVVAGVAVFAAAVFALKLARTGTIDVLIRYVLVSLCVGAAGAVLMILAYAVHDLVGELERAREREAEVAVMRERVRFAGDLHDIQGHTLHVVKLKVALAERLLHTDLGHAERELHEVRDLLGATIAQTKDLAYAQRRLNLTAELENAKNLFEAAGIRVRVERAGEVDPRVSDALGQVLRETTTNILRHSDATEVHIALTASGLSVTNDGLRSAAPPRLSGLAALRDRLAAQGATLTVTQTATTFRTTVAFPP